MPAGFEFYLEYKGCQNGRVAKAERGSVMATPNLDFPGPTDDGPATVLVAEGKTKMIYRLSKESHLSLITAKDDITAGDGKKHDVIAGKALLATATTCNVFRLLKECGIPVAFEKQLSPTSFIAPLCAMLPYEVVVRREAHGSYLVRYPHLTKGHRFPKLLVEFFLKTKDKEWKGKPLVCDDPYTDYVPGAPGFRLYDVKKPFHGQEPFLTLAESEVFSADEEWKCFADMEKIARKTFLILERAWQIAGRKLVDFKVEFGFDHQGTLLLADVIDNDSWRVIEDGRYIDKQVYRDGGLLSTVADHYAQVAEITSSFRLPAQQLILWRGSESDDFRPFDDAYQLLRGANVVKVTCSAHKEPERAVRQLREHIANGPDSVLITYIGMSNGAGPTLAAQTTIPTIAVPATTKTNPEDVWSSLRVPSNVPLLTVLSPANAMLAAANIFAARNPEIYARLQYAIEERT